MSSRPAVQPIEDPSEFTLDQYVKYVDAPGHEELGRAGGKRYWRTTREGRYQNGADKFGVFARQGRNLYVHLPSFRRWFASYRGS